VLVSSVGRDLLAKAFYLRVKGEVEAAVTRLKFRRLDILRPGCCAAPRGRPASARTAGHPRSPLADLGAAWRQAALPLDRRALRRRRRAAAYREKAAGRFVHENDAIVRAARRLEG
jgi:uncharacterized protein YbjT (DUF2867 family)